MLCSIISIRFVNILHVCVLINFVSIGLAVFNDLTCLLFQWFLFSELDEL